MKEIITDFSAFSAFSAFSGFASMVSFLLLSDMVIVILSNRFFGFYLFSSLNGKCIHILEEKIHTNKNERTNERKKKEKKNDNESIINTSAYFRFIKLDSIAVHLVQRLLRIEHISSKVRCSTRFVTNENNEYDDT